ncbi:MAG: class II glutamine amidotransferase [Thermoplasmata archaeon]|nr:class II glutamine amidotransferase [Thermoplasmata archaeon]
MCRLLGVVASERVPAGLLEEFATLAENGKIGADFGCSGDKTRGHKDGWGIAVLGGREIFYREGNAATESQKIGDILEQVSRVEPANLVMHLRRASEKTTISAEHSHPFPAEHARRKYYFAHNGGLENYRAIAHGGMIDSEYIFQNLLNYIDRGVISAVRKLRETLSYSSLNFLLLSEGEIYAYRDARKCPDYYSLYCASKSGLHVVCSERLKYGRMRWKKMRNPSLIRITEKGIEVLI